MDPCDGLVLSRRDCLLGRYKSDPSSNPFEICSFLILNFFWKNKNWRAKNSYSLHKNGSLKAANDWIRTADMWCREILLWQNYQPEIVFYPNSLNFYLLGFQVAGLILSWNWLYCSNKAKINNSIYLLIFIPQTFETSLDSYLLT